MSRKPVFRPRAVELDILAIGARGDGLAKWENDPVFVPLTVPGDRVLVRLDGRRGDGVAASLIEILQPGPLRGSPPCPLFGRCGGCSLQHVAPAGLASWKRDRLLSALGRIGVGEDVVQPLIAIAPGTRRRASFAFIRLRQGVVLGFNERAGPQIVEIDPCLLLTPALLTLLPPLRALLTACIAPGGKGDAVVTETDNGIDLLLRSDQTLDLFARETLARFAETQDLARLSWQRGTESEPVAHRRAAMVRMGPVMVTLPPGGFLQPSREGEAALVSLVKDHLPADGPLADLYAGSGSFTFPLAASGHRVHAVEGDPDAIAALSLAARQTGLPISTEHRDLARRPLLAAELKEFAGLLFDPPRAGALAQMEILAKAGPETVIAVSCNPATLARDAAVLIRGGYRLESATPVDQFPWSAHLEVVAAFRRP